VGLKLAVLADQLVLGSMEQLPQDNNSTKRTLFRRTS
jgi:hypothetical protein